MLSLFHNILQPELLEKHGWKANDAILTEEETVFEELKEYKVGGDQESLGLVRHFLHSIQVDHIAGGATQNSIRVAQWLLGGQVIQ